MTNHHQRQVIPSIIAPSIHDGVYLCPCGASHTRGPVNGVDSYRCLACGEAHRVPSKVDQQLQADNLRTWLEFEALKAGTDNQRERHMAGVLPEDELTFLARDQLFAEFRAFGELRRWAGRDRGAVQVTHAKTCSVDGWVTKFQRPPHVDLETCDITELAAGEWDTLKAVEKLAGEIRRHEWVVRGGGKVSVVASTHWATCRSCTAEACRSSVKVTVEWAGRMLTREYAL